MSGGSFNYLCEASFSEHKDDLKRMADELDHIGFYDLAKETRSYISEPPQGLRKVWKAVEWWQSCDWSVRQAVEAAQEYERQKTKEANPPG